MRTPEEYIAFSPLIRLSFHEADAKLHSTLQFSRFLYEFNLLYETCRLVTDPRYRDFQFPQYTFRRQVSPLKPQHRLLVDRIRQESPWELAVSALADPHTIHAMAGLITCLAKAILVGRAISWLLDQENKRVEIIKVRRETKQQAEKAPLEKEKLEKEIESLKLGNEEKRRQLAKTSAQVEQAPELIEVANESALELIGSQLNPRALQRRLNSRGATKFAERSAHILKELNFRSDNIEADFIVRPGNREIL